MTANYDQEMKELWVEYGHEPDIKQCRPDQAIWR
jgi:hypothetical protein